MDTVGQLPSPESSVNADEVFNKQSSSSQYGSQASTA